MKNYAVLITAIKIAIILSGTTKISSSELYAATPTFMVTGLKVEYTATPLGIDVDKPRFSWQMLAGNDERGSMQKAFQVTVTDESGQQVWDSGRMESDVSLNIEYAGIPLQPVTRYAWTLKVWNSHGEMATNASWFETGLMNHFASGVGWDDAVWIGGGEEDRVLYSQYLSAFRIGFFFQFHEGSQAPCAGFIYGANDIRLMNKDKNIYHLQNAKDESYIKVELDLSPLSSNEQAVMNIYRVGYHPDDSKSQPFHQIKIPGELINRNNMYDKHTIHLSSVYGDTHFFLDEKNVEVGSVNLNPLGKGGNYIAFPVLGDLGVDVLEGEAVTFSDVMVADARSPRNIIAKIGELVNSPQGHEGRLFRTVDPSRNSMPMLRTVFPSQGTLAKARLYVTARGIYEMYINGNRVGDDYFNPGITQYNKTHLYQTYDVTELVRQGDNAMGAWLAEGWWCGASTYQGEAWNFFGDRPSLLAKLVLTYTDGTEDVIVTNPGTWQYCNSGPVLYGSLFQGEVYDALRDSKTEGWSMPGYDTSGWESATEVTLQQCVSHEGWGIAPAPDDYSAFQLVGQFGQTVKAIKELTALSVEEVRPGVYVYDMGQNMVGVPHISLDNMAPGTQVCLRYAEVKYPDLPEYAGNVGMIMLENIRAAMAQDIYITKGGRETISPHFTFHGYRYVEVTGIEEPLPVKAVKGIVLSSIDGLASHYETSNPKVNRLWENITWSTYGNFLSIPTDCPQRNERLGWAGDISVFSRTATYMGCVPQFLRRYLRSMRDVQRPDGRFPDVAPLGGGFGGILWGSAGITVAWESYQQYQDKALLQEHYDAMKRYIQHILEKRIHPETGLWVKEKMWGNLGDWLAPEDARNDRSLLWESYFIYDLQMMRKMALALDKQEDAQWYQRLYDQRKAHFANVYIRPEDGKTISSGYGGSQPGKLVDTQTSYALPLVFGFLDDSLRMQVADNLRNTVVRENVADGGMQCPSYSLMTGFIGTAWVSKALSDNGYNDIAYRLLQQTSYPSWLYPVEQGATTIWERLNSYTHLDGFGGNNGMNSFNHYSFGSVGAWMCNYSLGILRDEDSPGFKHFILKPMVDPTGQMTHAEGHYDSMYGRIESAWTIHDATVRYDFTVPANTTAHLCLPAPSLAAIKESGTPVSPSASHIKYKGAKDGCIEMELQSGKYSFEVGNTVAQ